MVDKVISFCMTLFFQKFGHTSIEVAHASDPRN